MPDINMQVFEEVKRNQHSIDIEIDASQIASPQQNFPMMLETPNSANSVLNVVAINELGEQLPTEIEGIANNKNWIHLKDLVQSVVNRKIKVFYSGSGKKPADSAYGSEAVWNEYENVWLFNNDPSVSNLFDSTGNNNYGTMSGSMTSGDLIDGDYGKGINFDGVDDYFTLVNSYIMPSAFTVEIFANLDNTAPEYSDDFIYLFESVDDFIGFNFNANNELGWHVQQTSNIDRRSRTDGSKVVPTTNQYYVLSKTGNDDVDVFVDAVEDITRAALTQDDWAGYNRIGGKEVAGRNHFVDGNIFQIRYSTVKHTSNHTLTTYKNLNNPTAIGTDPFYKSISKEHNFVESLQSLGRAG